MNTPAVFIPVGGTFTVKGKTFICCEGDEDCIRCAFHTQVCVGWQCSRFLRPDKKDVYFKEVIGQTRKER